MAEPTRREPPKAQVDAATALWNAGVAAAVAEDAWARTLTTLHEAVMQAREAEVPARDVIPLARGARGLPGASTEKLRAMVRGVYRLARVPS